MVFLIDFCLNLVFSHFKFLFGYWSDRIWILHIKVLHVCIVHSSGYSTCSPLLGCLDPDRCLGLSEHYLIIYQIRYLMLCGFQYVTSLLLKIWTSLILSVIWIIPMIWSVNIQWSCSPIYSLCILITLVERHPRELKYFYLSLFLFFCWLPSSESPQWKWVQPAVNSFHCSLCYSLAPGCIYFASNWFLTLLQWVGCMLSLIFIWNLSLFKIQLFNVHLASYIWWLSCL